MQLEVKLTGIMSTGWPWPTAMRGRSCQHDVAPGLAAPYHQHLFNVRLDMQVDGPDNEVYEVDAVPTGAPGSPENPWGNAFGTTKTLLESELEARRDVDAVAQGRAPGASPTRPNGTEWGKRLRTSCCRGPRRRCWPTPLRASVVLRHVRIAPPRGHALRSRRTPCRGRLSQSATRPCRRADLDGRGSTHCRHRHRAVAYVRRHPHPAAAEDWPVMPVEYTGFTLLPYGFFDRNPALDVPPSSDHCHD